MAKKDWKSKAKALKAELKTHLAEAVPAKAAKMVSPLAPAHFPKLPLIAGAEFAAVEAGVRYLNRKDVMLIRLAPGTAIAGAFTRSSTRSGCVRDCQAKLATKVPPGAGAAIIVNSGNSNAFTGATGDHAVAEITAGVAAALGLPANRVFSSSTGVIGEPLPFERITAQIPALTAALREDAIEMAANAMMTTDTFPKGATAKIQGDGGVIQIAGIAKGSGMIAPDMATMLVYLFTDAKIAPATLQKMLSRNVDPTFNSITVDSDTSTSDSLILAATGMSGAAPVTGAVARAFEAERRDDGPGSSGCPRRRRRHEIRRNTGHGRGGQRRRPPRRPRSRQLALGQDRHRRPRPKLGPHRRCHRQVWRQGRA